MATEKPMAPSTSHQGAKHLLYCLCLGRLATHHQDAAVPRIMKLKAIIVAGMLLAAFALGVLVGSRLRHKASVTALDRPARTRETERGGEDDAPCVGINNAGSLIGKSGCVAGQVLRVFTSRGGNTFLDFCQDYRSCSFTSVIFAGDKDKFGNLESLQGMKVEIHGDIKNYNDRAEIIIHDPHQITTAP